MLKKYKNSILFINNEVVILHHKNKIVCQS